MTQRKAGKKFVYKDMYDRKHLVKAIEDAEGDCDNCFFNNPDDACDFSQSQRGPCDENDIMLIFKLIKSQKLHTHESKT
jgi:hypothetical protein